MKITGKNLPLRVSILMLLLMLSVFAPISLFADTIVNLKFNVVLPDNTTPAQNLDIHIIDEFYNDYGWYITDASGEITSAVGFQEGVEYTLEILPRTSIDLEKGGLYRSKFLKFTPFKTDSEYNSGSDEYVVPQFRLNIYSRYIKVYVNDGVSPISGYRIDAYRYNDPSMDVWTKTDSSGEAFIGIELADNDPIDIYGYDMSGYYDSYYGVVSGAPAQTITNKNISLGQTSATIYAQLYDQSYNPYTATATDAIVVTCQDRNSTQFYSAPITNGNDYVSIDVADGEYDCSFIINGLEGYPYYVNVGYGGAEYISQVVPQLTSQITANLKNSNQAVYYLQPGEYASLECYNSYYDLTFTKAFSSGSSSATVNVYDGSYDCHVKYKSTRGFDEYIYVYTGTPQSFTYTVYPTDATIRAALVDTNNSPYTLIPGETAHLICDDENYTRHYEKPISVGYSSTSIEVAAGSYYCFIDYDGTGGYSEYVTVATNSTKTINATVQSRSATLIARLKDSSGNIYTLQSGEYASVYCYDTVSGNPYYKDFKPNFSTATLRVVPGTYDCSIFFDANSSVNVRTTVASGQTKYINYQQPTRDATVKLRAINSTTGKKVTGVDIDYNVSSISPYGPSDYRYATNATGEATFTLVSNLDYVASLYILDDSMDLGAAAADFARDGFVTANGVTYGIERNFIEFSTTGGSQTIDIKLTPLTTFLNINAKDKNGNLITAGWVSVEHYSYNSDAATVVGPSPSASASASPTPITGALNGPLEDLYYGAEITNGVAQVAVLGDRKYDVRVFPYTDSSGEDFPPPPQTVTPATGQTLTLNFEVLKPNYDLTVQTTIVEGDKSGTLSTQEVFCYANNANDQFAYGDGTSNVLLKLLVVKPKKPEKWNIHCHAIIREGDEYRFYYGETIYRPKRLSSSDTLSLTLIDEGAFYEQESKTFNSTTDAEFKIAGGVELALPKGALPQSSTALLKSGTAKGYRSPVNAKVVNALDISFIVNGENVEELETGASICFPIDEDDIKSKYGADADSIYIASYNESTGTWSKDEVDATVRRSDDGSVAICTSNIRHFSIWGSIVDYIKEARESLCSNLKARKVNTRKKKTRKSKRVRFTWSGPESATDITKYEVDLLKSRKKVNRKKCENKSDEDWEKASTYEVVGSRLIRNMRKGNYCWRSRVKDGQNTDPGVLKVKK